MGFCVCVTGGGFVQIGLFKSCSSRRSSVGIWILFLELAAKQALHRERGRWQAEL
jgi:hypothetical protein